MKRIGLLIELLITTPSVMEKGADALSAFSNGGTWNGSYTSRTHGSLDRIGPQAPFRLRISRARSM